MEPALKQRLIGAMVLVALAVIFLPMLIKGPAPESGASDVSLKLPDAPPGDYETRELPLVTPGNAPAGGALGMDAQVGNDGALPTVDTTTAGVATADAGVGRLDGDRVGTLDGACVGSPVGCPVPDCPGAQAASTAAPAAPMSASASLRLRTRPTC